MDILKNGNLEDENQELPLKGNPQIPEEFLNAAIEDAKEIISNIDPSELNEMMSKIVSADSSSINNLISLGETISQLNLDLTGMKIDESTKDINQENSYLSSPYFFKRIILENMGNFLDAFKIGEVNKLSDLISKNVSKFSFYPFIEMENSVEQFFEDAGYNAFIVINKNNNYATLKIGSLGSKKTSFYIVLYKEAGEYKIYIPTWMAPLKIDEDEEKLEVIQEQWEDYSYNLECEIKTIFIYPNAKNVTLDMVGTVVVNNSVTKIDSNIFELGTMTFKETAAANLMKRDLCLDDTIETVEIYAMCVDPENGNRRTMNNSEAALMKEYLRFVNNYDLEGHECFEGRFNLPEISKNLEVRIINNRIVLIFDIGRIVF